MDITERRRAADALRAIKRGGEGWYSLSDAVLGRPAPRDEVVARLAELIDPGDSDIGPKTLHAMALSQLNDWEREAIAWVREHGGIAYVKDAWNVRSNLEVSVSAYDLLSDEDRETLRWVRAVGGLEEIRWSYRGSENRRVELCAALGIDMNTGWSDAMAEMVKRLMPEGLSWPVFEDGEPVRIGDDFEDLGQVAGIKFCASGVTIEGTDGNSDLFITSDERVKRPAPKVLDADGVEIRVGERVRSKWSHDGWWYVVTRIESPWKVSLKAVKDGSETVINAANLTHRDSVFDADGEPCEVGDAVWWTRNLAGSFRIIRIEQDGKCAIRDDDPDEPCGMTIPADQLTHRAPVLAADGRPLREGETVWDTNGDELVIGALEDGGHTVTCRYAAVGDAIPVHGMWSPSQLTHTKPEIDTWERIEEDAGKNPFDYCKDVGHRLDTCENSEAYKARDLVRRAKKLAERSE